MKVALDSLQDVAYDDDKQVAALSVHRGLPVPGGTLVVTIELADLDRAFRPAQAALALPEPDTHPTAESA